MALMMLPLLKMLLVLLVLVVLMVLVVLLLVLLALQHQQLLANQCSLRQELKPTSSARCSPARPSAFV